MADDDPDVAAEEEKLARMLDKKAKLKFEEKRQQELLRYQQQTGKPVEFKLQTATEFKPTNFSTVTPIQKRESTSDVTNKSSQQSSSSSSQSEEQQNEYLRWREEQRKREAEEKAREQEEEQRRKERAQQLLKGNSPGSQQSDFTSGSTSFTPSYKSPSGGFSGTSYKAPQSFVPVSSFTNTSNGRPASLYGGSGGGGNWREQREQKEREERLRKEEEERKRKEKATAVIYESPDAPRPVSTNLSWKEQQLLKEQQERARLEEEERKRQEKAREVVYQGQSELEDYERRKREEEERKRQELYALEQQKYEATKAQVPCKSCGTMLDLASAQNIKGGYYCSLCGPRAVIGATGACASCNRQLGLTIAKAANKKYHPECLVCYSCKTNIQGGFRQAFGQLWCVDCKPFNPQQ